MSSSLERNRLTFGPNKNIIVRAFPKVSVSEMTVMSRSIIISVDHCIAKAAQKIFSVTSCSIILVFDAFKLNDGAPTPFGDWNRLDNSHWYEAPFRTITREVSRNFHCYSSNDKCNSPIEIVMSSSCRVGFGMSW